MKQKIDQVLVLFPGSSVGLGMVKAVMTAAFVRLDQAVAMNTEGPDTEEVEGEVGHSAVHILDHSMERMLLRQ